MRETCKRGHPWIPENLYSHPQNGDVCRICKRDAIKRSTAKKPDYYRALNAKNKRLYHAKTIQILGGKCACCGRLDRLEIDHTHGGGKQHFKAKGKMAVYRDARNHPEDYQALCAPCNTGKADGEFCDIPEHQQYRLVV